MIVLTKSIRDELCREITRDDMPEAYRQLAYRLEEEGVDADTCIKMCLIVSELYGGLSYAVPKFDDAIMRVLKRRVICELKQGAGYDALVRKYSVSERMIRTCQQEMRQEGFRKRQMAIF